MSENNSQENNGKGFRSLLSWLTPCERPETLDTINLLNLEQTRRVIKIVDQIKEVSLKRVDVLEVESVPDYIKTLEKLGYKVSKQD